LSAIAVIPARYASTRFPGKPLANKTGKCLIQHVYERVAACRSIDRVIVATDDDRIVEAVKSFGGEVRMTRPDHTTGTDRIGEVAATLGLANDDLVLNVQGDEPEIDPQALDRLIECMKDEGGSCPIGTLAAPFADDGLREGPGSPLDPNCVKVVVDATGRALYFSRSLVPYPRDTGGRVERPSRRLLHLGVYAFRWDALRTITGGTMRRTAAEQTESLEQLRWLEHGMSIRVVIVDRAFAGIDTPEDYAAFVARTSSAVPDAGRHGQASACPCSLAKVHGQTSLPMPPSARIGMT
jgi:3-deoxy-manno-octulosonate cytidylyltransferase (CMP-KDO synthetase)